MSWKEQQEFLAQHLSPEVVGFVREALVGMERENVVDAPSVISGVLTRMRVAELESVRRAAARTEELLKKAFLLRFQRVRA